MSHNLVIALAALVATVHVSCPAHAQATQPSMQLAAPLAANIRSLAEVDKSVELRPGDTVIWETAEGHSVGFLPFGTGGSLTFGQVEQVLDFGQNRGKLRIEGTSAYTQAGTGELLRAIVRDDAPGKIEEIQFWCLVHYASGMTKRVTVAKEKPPVDYRPKTIRFQGVGITWQVATGDAPIQTPGGGGMAAMCPCMQMMSGMMGGMGGMMGGMGGMMGGAGNPGTMGAPGAGVAPGGTGSGMCGPGPQGSGPRMGMMGGMPGMMGGAGAPGMMAGSAQGAAPGAGMGGGMCGPGGQGRGAVPRPMGMTGGMPGMSAGASPATATMGSREMPMGGAMQSAPGGCCGNAPRLGAMANVSHADPRLTNVDELFQTHPLLRSAQSRQASSSIIGQGKVVRVEPSKRSINLSHGPIPAINWPAMTMDFVVGPTVDLSTIKPGQDVEFTLEPAPGNQYVISSMRPFG
jgi:Cu/Ag efflux protein CusF/plastocyanin